MQVTVSYNPFDKTELASLKKIAGLDLNTLASAIAADESPAVDTDEEAPPAKKTRAKKGKPEPTVSEDEDEDFGAEAVDEDDLSEDDAEESDDAEEDEDALPWETVKEAINKYGNKKPEEMKTILLSFNFKSTKELQQHKNKWEPVYRKVMAKLKAPKKGK